jgi:hypothetical protein
VPRSNEAVTSIDSDPDLASARLAAINQSPDAQDRNNPPEHPAIAFARNLLSPMNYQSQVPQGFNQFAIPQPAPTSFGNTERAGVAQPYQPYTPSPFDFTGTNTGPAGQMGYDVTKAISQIPVIGGALNYSAHQLEHGPAGSYLLGSNPDFNAIQAMPEGPEKVRAKQAFQESLMGNAAMGAVGGLESTLGKAAVEATSIEGGLTGRIGAKPALGVPTEGAGPIQTAEQIAAVKSKPTTAELQAASDAFNKAAGTTAEVTPKRPAMQTAEGQALNPSLLTRSLQTAAGSEGVPLSQHPVFSAYGKGGAKVGAQGAVGGDIGTATRAVMAGDPAAMDLLGPDLTQQLIQNKIAHIVRETGAPEDVIRRGLSVMVEKDGAGAAEAASSAVVQEGRAASKGTGWSDTPSVPAPEPVVAPPQTVIPSDPRTVSPPPSSVGTGQDYSVLIKSMRDQGATDDEIRKFVGFNPPPPTSGEPPVPPVGGKDGFPPNLDPKLPEPSRADFASAIYRNYVVSNALSPFTLAIKASADLLKAADSTLEAVSRGITSGRPAQIPGSIGALYGGFWRSITQDAVTAFKNRSYSLGSEGKTYLINEMLSGKWGPQAKRAAQASDVLSLGSPIPRTISALTSIFQRGYRDMALYQEGYAAAAKQGLEGADAHTFASKFMANPLAQDGGKAALERATADANTRTWTNSNPLSRIPGRDKPILGDALFSITPFVNLVTNIGREGLEFVPGVGALAKGVEAATRKGGVTSAEWTRVAQHQLMGSAATLALGMKAASGEVTGDGPDQSTQAGKTKYFDMVQQGWKPNHTKIGDNWYPNIAFGVIAPLLNAIGNTHDNLVYNTAAQDRESAIAKAGSALNGIIKGELDSVHWLDTLLNLSSAINGSASEQQQFVNQWISLLVPQSGTLKVAERVVESATPAISQNADLLDSMRQRFFRQYPPALRPSDLQNMQPGVQRSETGASAVLPFLGSSAGPGGVYDAVGVPEGNPNYNTDTIIREAARLGALDSSWRQGGVIEPPSPTIGKGDNQIRLDAISSQKYIQMVGEQRQRIVGALLSSSKYQNATPTQQQAQFDAALTQANDFGKSEFLAKGVVDATDPKMIVSQAVEGFTAQPTGKDKAYWVSLLDRAGKLTPDVSAAIDALKEPIPGEKVPFTVSEYLKSAPLIHEYLSHVPYGTDKSPIGTPVDWAAVAQATKDKNTRVDELIRSGVNRTLADSRAQQEILKSLTSLVQRNLFLNGTQLENPARKLFALKNPNIKRFVSDTRAPNESDSAYQNFPTGTP